MTNNSKKEPSKMTLVEALEILGESNFWYAIKANAKELNRLINHDDAWFGGVEEAYETIKLFRQACGDKLA